MKRYIIGIDPGSERSAYVVFDSDKSIIIDRSVSEGSTTKERCTVQNEYLPDKIKIKGCDSIYFPFVRENSIVLIENISPRGTRMGYTTRDTANWIGRFAGRFEANLFRVELIDRDIIKKGLLNCTGNDSLMIEYLKRKYGNPGTKKDPGLLFGLKGDHWQAFGLIEYYMQREAGEIK